MPESVKVVGSYISPYVRKVLVVLHLKGVPYEIDPIIPFYGNDQFTSMSPIRRVPVLVDERVTLPDSSVICQYLEELHPEPALYPRDIATRARARWLEEYADTRMGDVFIWRLFNQAAIYPYVWGATRDLEELQRIMHEEMPPVLDYLETQMPADGFLCGSLSIADISVAVFFRNSALARFTVDDTRWPRTAAFVERVLGMEAFMMLRPFEDLMMRTPIPKHREALAAAGAPLTPETYGTKHPRRGVMTI